jgi:hypothetical protein
MSVLQGLIFACQVTATFISTGMTSTSDPQNKALAQPTLEAKRNQNPLNSKSKHPVYGNDFAY